MPYIIGMIVVMIFIFAVIWIGIYIALPLLLISLLCSSLMSLIRAFWPESRQNPTMEKAKIPPKTQIIDVEFEEIK